jgi:hypothetical protein
MRKGGGGSGRNRRRRKEWEQDEGKRGTKNSTADHLTSTPLVNSVEGMEGLIRGMGGEGRERCPTGGGTQGQGEDVGLGRFM